MQFTRPRDKPFHRRSYRNNSPYVNPLINAQRQRQLQIQSEERANRAAQQNHAAIQREIREKRAAQFQKQQEQMSIQQEQEPSGQNLSESIREMQKSETTPSLNDIFENYKSFIKQQNGSNSTEWITPQIENDETGTKPNEVLWKKAKDEFSKCQVIYDEALRKKLFLENDGAKIGVVITTHGDNGVFARQTIESCIRELPTNTFIILFINESQDPITIGLKEMFPEIKVVNVENQRVGGGLTGTWNRGIEECIRAACDVIVLANDDILFDSSVTHVMHSAYMDNSAPGNVYCPVSNAPGPGGPLIGAICPFNRQQLSPGPRNEDDYELLVNNNQGNCNGFFMVFPTQTLQSNIYKRGCYFDPKFPFGGNEVEWCKRFISIGGKVTVVPKTFIYHYKNMAWRSVNTSASNTCLYTINTGGYEGKEILISTFEKLPFEKLYFTDNLDQIYNCIRENVIPFYISTACGDTKLIQRTVKTSPHLYIPSRYEKSIYMDGNVYLHDHVVGAEGLILSLLKINKDLISFAHPTRTKAIDECAEVIKLGLETEENVNSIVETWKKLRFPDNVGLAETNVLVRNHKRIIKFSEDWTNCIGMCRRDQVSFDFLRWKHNVNDLMLSNERKKTMFHKKKHANPVRRKVVEK